MKTLYSGQHVSVLERHEAAEESCGMCAVPHLFDAGPCLYIEGALGDKPLHVECAADIEPSAVAEWAVFRFVFSQSLCDVPQSVRVGLIHDLRPARRRVQA